MSNFNNPPHKHIVRIDYENWRGERSVRNIVPEKIEWKSTEHHPQPQYLLRAWDVDKGAYRDFALSKIYGWFDVVEVRTTDFGAL